MGRLGSPLFCTVVQGPHRSPLGILLSPESVFLYSVVSKAAHCCACMLAPREEGQTWDLSTSLLTPHCHALSHKGTPHSTGDWKRQSLGGQPGDQLKLWGFCYKQKEGRRDSGGRGMSSPRFSLPLWLPYVPFPPCRADIFPSPREMSERLIQQMPPAETQGFCGT